MLLENPISYKLLYVLWFLADPVSVNISHYYVYKQNRKHWYLKTQIYIWDNFECEFVLCEIIYLKHNIKMKEWSSCSNNITRLVLGKVDGKKTMRTHHKLNTTQRTTSNQRILRMKIIIYATANSHYQKCTYK